MFKSWDVAVIFSSSIRVHYFNLNLKYIKFIKRFRSLTYGINITIVREIVCEGNK
jgi:hypothetical protein